MFLELLSTKLFRYEARRQDFSRQLETKLNLQLFLRLLRNSFHSKRVLLIGLNLVLKLSKRLKKKHYKKIPLTFQDLNEMNLKPQQINYFLVLEYKSHNLYF